MNGINYYGYANYRRGDGWHDVRFEASVNNLFDRRYYTRRTSTGISPADGRTVTAGLRLDFAARGR